MKINIIKGEVIQLIIGIAMVIALITLFGDFLQANGTFSLLIFLLFFANYLVVLWHERKYKENFPYKPYKSKKNVFERMLMGLLAGLHYFFFIGTYNHKHYNTQVEYPETLECFFGNISQALILFAYVFISIKIFESFEYYSLFFLIIPIITNLISLRKY